jgi:transaldolase
VGPTLTSDNGQGDLDALRALGVDLDAITRELETEGVASFRESGDKLLASMAQKAGAVVAAPT